MAVEIAIPFVGNSVLLVSNGMTGATGNWYCGLHEPCDMGFTLHFLRPGDMFVDIGANIGSYSILAAQAGASVICVEPISSTFECLVRNITINGFDGLVDARRQGISDVSGMMSFTSTHDTMNHALSDMEAAASSDVVEVAVTTLDELCDRVNPVLIKIDVEGLEGKVLRGGEKTLSAPTLRAVIMETNGSGDRYRIPDSFLVESMKRHGFQSATYDPRSRSLMLQEPKFGSNTIFLRDFDKVAGIVANAPEFTLVNRRV